MIENWNSANDFILYGKGGEFASNRLHLPQVSLVYVNTLMIQQVLDEPEWRDRLTAVDLRALSPLKWQHVNPVRHVHAEHAGADTTRESSVCCYFAGISAFAMLRPGSRNHEPHRFAFQ